jgi:thiamine biosynthesis lipoprotein
MLANKKRTKQYIFAFLIFVFLLSSCSTDIEMESRTDFKLGTICTISLPAGTDNEVFEECFQILDKVEGQISRTIPNSDISVLNKDKHLTIQNEIFVLLKSSYEICKDSSGAFNPSLGAAVSLWDIGGDNPRIPSDKELSEIDTDYNNVVMKDLTHEVLIPDNMEIDLGAVGKGYSANMIRKFLQGKGIEHAIINLGGNILLIGEKSKNTDWTIGLQDPDKDTGSSYILLSLSDTSVVTSGTYERFFEKDGKRYHHILSSKTLYPAESDIISSTIISKNSTLCDILSTACFVMGSKEALEYIKKYKGVSAIFLLKDGSIVTSENFDFEYKILNDNYHIL